MFGGNGSNGHRRPPRTSGMRGRSEELRRLYQLKTTRERRTQPSTGSRARTPLVVGSVLLIGLIAGIASFVIVAIQGAASAYAS